MRVQTTDILSVSCDNGQAGLPPRRAVNASAPRISWEAWWPGWLHGQVLRAHTASFGQIRSSPVSLDVQVPAERIEAPWRLARLRNSRRRAALALDMIFGQPKRSAAQPRPGDSSNPLEQEILQEQAATLGRVARELEAALGALENFDRANPDREALSPDDQRRRAALVEGGGEILW